MKSQTKRIQLYLERGKKLTQLQALRLFQCLRLGARIHELRQLGYNIVGEMVKDRKTGKSYARYYLVDAVRAAEARTQLVKECV